MGFSFKKLAKGIGKLGKRIIKSPITKAVVGGAAIVFPPVGVPAAAAVAVAGAAVSAAEQGNAAAKQAIKLTQQLAAKGDPNAKRAVNAMKFSVALKKGNPVAKAKMARMMRQLPPSVVKAAATPARVPPPMAARPPASVDALMAAKRERVAAYLRTVRVLSNGRIARVA